MLKTRELVFMLLLDHVCCERDGDYICVNGAGAGQRGAFHVFTAAV